MKILVTGATGCLGGVTARKLAAGGVEVLGLGRDTARGAALTRDGVTFVQTDLGDALRVLKAAEGVDVIIHCGGLSSNWGPRRAFEEANVQGTAHVIAAAQANKARLVFVSSPSIYFDRRDRLDILESEGPARRPVNDYAWSKIEAERLIGIAAGLGLDAVIIRPRAIFGESDTALLPRLLRVAAKGYLPLIGGGRAVVDLTYVDNAADALILAARRQERFKGEAINISNGEPIDVKTLFEQLSEALGLKVRLIPVPHVVALGLSSVLELVAHLVPGRPEPRLTRYSVGVLGKSHTLSLGAARAELGYRPAVSVQEGIERTVTAWKSAHA